MRYRDANDPALFVFFGKRSVGVLHLEIYISANEVKISVPKHSTGKQSGLKQYLKAVADANYEFSSPCKFNDPVHNRGKSRYGASSQVISVAEAAGEYQGVEVVEFIPAVPDVFSLLPKDISDNVIAVHIAVGAGEDKNACFQDYTSSMS
jgi:hypothetical protein